MAVIGSTLVLQGLTLLTMDGNVPDSVVERARTTYANRARQLAGLCRAGVPVDEQGDEDVWRRVRRDLIGVERRALLELRDQGAVSAAVVNEVERELDLEEERLHPLRRATGPRRR